ncbi:MAG: alkaline phosphatase family protein [Acidobacteriota bacterium]
MTRPELSLFVFCDAFGWRLLNEHSFMEDVLTVRAPVDTVLGYSSTCVPTILTGRHPHEHGHFAFFRYDPASSPFSSFKALELLPRSVTSRGRVRRWISKLVQRWHGYTGYFQLYDVPWGRLPDLDYTEKKDLYEEGGINNGCPTIFDRLREAKLRFHVSDWRKPEEHNLRSLLHALEHDRPVFAYLYLAHLDGVMHQYGSRSEQAATKIAWYDQQLRKILERAHELYSDVRLHLISDHGMADVDRTVNLMARIDALGLRYGKDYAAVYDSTMARFWFLEDGIERRVREALAEEPLGRVVEDDELVDLGCNFEGKTHGELIFLVEPGVMIVPSFMGGSSLAGMHGYVPSDIDGRASFAATHAPETMPAHLTDHHELMWSEACRAAGTDFDRD